MWTSIAIGRKFRIKGYRTGRGRSARKVLAAALSGPGPSIVDILIGHGENVLPIMPSRRSKQGHDDRQLVRLGSTCRYGRSAWRNRDLWRPLRRTASDIRKV